MLSFSHCREKAYRMFPVDIIAAMSRNGSAKPASHPETTPVQIEVSRWSN
jgi:hypothetical protein